MKRLRNISVLALLFWLLSWNVVEACYCGVSRWRCRVTCSCQVASPGHWVTVMKTCPKVIYEEKECTFYKTVYEDVTEKKVIPTTRFVEETAYRCMPFTGLVPKPAEACEPVRPACAPNACEEMQSVSCLRKVPYTTYREEPAEKIEETTRVVAKQVPYTVICCVPKTIYVQVPVTVCCPQPCGCDTTSSPANEACR